MPKRHLKIDILLLISAVFLSLCIGATVFSLAEGWSLLDAFYFTTMTATTVGYGDFAPETPLGKFLTILFSLAIIPFVLYTFSFVANAQMNKVYRTIHHLEKKQLEQEEAIDEAEKKLKAQKALLKKQEALLKLEKKEVQAQKRELAKEIMINKLQNVKLLTQDAELEVVESSFKQS